jgi:hypothetical protein
MVQKALSKSSSHPSLGGCAAHGCVDGDCMVCGEESALVKLQDSMSEWPRRESEQEEFSFTLILGVVCRCCCRLHRGHAGEAHSDVLQNIDSLASNSGQ